jgi:uncharacterized membrane protein/Mg-chelatase subunit ChlD
VRFADPAGWWLLALAVPVIALHVLRPRREPQVVSSTRLWERVDRPVSSTSPWQRLRPSWLLLVQLLAVALLAALVAQPVRLTGAPLRDHTVFVVDASGSMAALDGSPDRLAEARRRARGLREELPAGGVASIVVASDHPRVVLSASADEGAFDSALDAIRATTGQADFGEAFALGESLDTGVGSLGFVLLSDGGLTDEQQRLLPPGTTYEAIGERALNRAIGRVTVEPRGSGLHVRVTIRNTGGPAVVQPLRVDVDGRTVAQREVGVGAGESVDMELDVPAGDRVEAYLDGGDLLAADDVGVAVAGRRARMTVLVAGDATFVVPLLAAIPGVEVVTSPTSRPAAEGEDVAVYSGVPVPDDPGAPFLAIAPPGGAGEVTVRGTVERPAVTLVRADDPLLADVDLSDVAIATAQRVDAPAADVLVAGADGAPLLLRGQAGQTPFAYLTFALGDSNLPMQIAYPILGDRLLTELAGIALPSGALTVGEPLPVDPTRTTSVTTPSARVFDVGAGDAVPTADEPGFYTLATGSGAPRMVAVNPPPEESVLAPAPSLPVELRAARPGDAAPQGERSLVGWFAGALLAVLLVEWLLARRRVGVGRPQWRLSVGLRVAVALLTLAALLAPVVSRPATQVATVFVLDASASLGGGGQADAEDWVAGALDGRPGDALAGVVVFGGDARLERVVQRSSSFDGASVRVDDERTNLATAMRLAAAVLPTDSRRRMVLVTDGRPTEGGAVEEAGRLAEVGIAVDWHVVAGASGPDAAVAGVDVPSLARAGERIVVTATITSTDAGPATVALARDGEETDEREVELRAGENKVRFTDTATGTGIARYQVTVRRGDDTIDRNDTAFAAVTLEGPARVLVAEGSDGEAATLAAALEAAGLDASVIDAGNLPDTQELAGYTSIVLVDVDARRLSARQVADLRTAVEDLGRGLVTIGGPRSYGVGGYRASPLEELLPVYSEILDPKRRKTVAEVLSIDTSGSMAACHCSEDAESGGRFESGVNKTDISRAAAARAIEALTAEDEIGILAWSGQAKWAVELQPLPSDEVVQEGLASLHPQGSTNLRASLREAADALRESSAALKHIILFSDGFTDPVTIRETADEAAGLYDDYGITVSVVATGEGAAPDLEQIADAGTGRFYPGQDLREVPQIIADEAVIASRSFITEGEFLPEVTSSADVVAGLDASPPLLGYVATTAKPLATTLLRISEDRDPLLATWRAGLGTSTAWTSDASAAWSQRWARWDGYVGFWSKVVQDTFPAGDTQGAVDAVVRDGRLEIAVEGAAAFPDASTAVARVAGPDGQRLEVPLERTSATTFGAEVAAGRAGTYAVGVEVRDGARTVLSSTGLASESYAAEFRPGPPDEALLARLSILTGGRGDIEQGAAFDGAGLTDGVRRFALQGPLLLAAALLWPLAVVLSRLVIRAPRPAAMWSGLGRQVRRARASLPSLPGRDPTLGGSAPPTPPPRPLPPPAPPGSAGGAPPADPDGDSRDDASEPPAPTTLGKLLQKKRGGR